MFWKQAKIILVLYPLPCHAKGGFLGLLAQCTQCITADGEESDLIQVMSGVPQVC